MISNGCPLPNMVNCFVLNLRIIFSIISKDNPALSQKWPLKSENSELIVKSKTLSSLIESVIGGQFKKKILILMKISNPLL